MLPQSDPQNDDRELNKLEQSKVHPAFFWIELSLLSIAISIPILTWFIWEDPLLFQASGSLVVFCSVLTEFIILGKQNAKHIGNSARAARGQRPLVFSRLLNLVSYIALVVALYGTVIWGYGDRFFN